MRGTEICGAVALALVMLAGCSGGVTRTADQPGAEVTGVTEPTSEDTGSAEDTGTGGAQGVSVELPGLPIGGSQIEFSQPSRQCADVSLTGDPLPNGVRVQITRFAVPPQFSVSSEPCGSAPPCLGAELTADSGCQVTVIWSGEQLAEGDFASLAVSSAVATCDDQEECAKAVSIVAGAAPQTIGILLPFPEDTTDESTDSTSPSQ